MVRRLRKHRGALVALLFYNFVVFFPVVFMGRVVSPNDVFYHYSPWREARADQTVAQNALLNDPPTSYLTLMSLVKEDWSAFHWNPYIASGIPGFGSSAAAILSPFILLPALLLPLTWVYTGILFLKLNAAFFFAYGWLREERLGRYGAAVGAVVVAGAGVYAVHWLWQITNATVLYPALLWIVRRAMNRRRNSIVLMALVALAYALSGFPSTMAYGAWLVTIYAVVIMLRERIFPVKQIAAGAIAVLIALLIALPSLVPFAQLLGRSGYLELRAESSVTGVYPLSHWRGFIEPDRFGHPVYKNWTGDPQSRMTSNYVAATVYLGLLTLPLILLGIFNRRARSRLFWLLAAAVLIAAMFGAPIVARLMAELPGVRYSPLTRLGLLLPLAAGYLAAAGVTLFRRHRSTIAAIVAVLIAIDLGMFAGRFHPYLTPSESTIAETSIVRFLQAEPVPFRIAPFFDFLWPNTSELVRLEDVRSHFGSEAAYRRMLQRLDPSAWSGRSTVITFNSLNFNLTDPLAGLLGIRWFVEQPSIDIVKWGTFAATVPGVTETGTLPLLPGDRLHRTITVGNGPFWAIEFPGYIDEVQTSGARLILELARDGTVVWSRAFTQAEVNLLSKVYVPLRPYAREGESVELHVRSQGVRGWVLEGENVAAGEDRLFYGRVTTPVILDRELPEGRLFRNLAEIPRFRAVSRVRKLNFDEFLAARDLDFERETVITDDPVMPPENLGGAGRVELVHYSPSEQRVVTESPAPFFLASTEKLTPELAITIGGRNVEPIQVDGIFAGVTVPAGRHEIVFSRRLARGWWWAFYAGAILLVGVAVGEVWRGWRRRAGG
ncbi:MAG TPA: hypothetical protein VF701_16675 [Thermoanaerobaculia bacterium]